MVRVRVRVRVGVGVRSRIGVRGWEVSVNRCKVHVRRCMRIDSCAYEYGHLHVRRCLNGLGAHLKLAKAAGGFGRLERKSDHRLVDLVGGPHADGKGS